MNGTHPDDTKSTSKRKATGDSNPLVKAAKRAKKDSKTAGSKRKAPDAEEQQPGGLVIVRASATIPSPPKQRQLPSSLSTSQPPAPGPSRRPPSKSKSKSATSTSKPKSKSRTTAAVLPRLPEEHDLAIEEDVRRMKHESESLRRQSAAHTHAHASSSVPSATPSSFLTPAKSRYQGLSVVENSIGRSGGKAPRDFGVESSGGPSRRRASGSRGKRLSSSYEASGVIALPHTSVSDASFFKHIDADLPEYQRARQLLIWCAYRSMTPSSSTTSSILHTPKTPRRQPEEAGTSSKTSSLPELTPEEAVFLRELQEEAVRMLAEGNIDTSVSSHKDDDQQRETGEEKKTWWKPNEQNVRNRMREVGFRECINRAEQEDDGWGAVEAFYNNYCETFSNPSHSKGKEPESQRRRDVTPERSDSTLDKVRAATPDGKVRRAGTPKRGTTPEPAWPSLKLKDGLRWTPRRHDDTRWEDEIPTEFRGPSGLDMAKNVLSEDVAEDKLAQNWEDMRFKLDHLETYAYNAAQAVLISEETLNQRYGLISQRLTAMSAPPPFLSPAVDDVQNLLQALTRVDVTRPLRDLGGAAHRARREVERSHGDGGSERRLTKVEATGTPRRESRSAIWSSNKDHR